MSENLSKLRSILNDLDQSQKRIDAKVPRVISAFSVLDSIQKEDRSNFSLPEEYELKLIKVQSEGK